MGIEGLYEPYLTFIKEYRLNQLRIILGNERQVCKELRIY